MEASNDTMFAQIQQWQQQRFGKFTASEMHRLLASGKRPMTEEELKEAKEAKSKRTTVDTLFGDGAMTYINEKVAEALTGESKPDISTLKALEWGAANELDAMLTFKEIKGIDFEYFGVSTPKFFEYTEMSGGSPDGLTEPAVIEAKCPFVSANHIPYLVVQKHNEGTTYETLWLKENQWEYYVQTQFNMMCTGKKQAFFLSYDPRVTDYRHRLAILTISIDHDLQADIKHRIEEATKIVKEKIALLNV